MKFWFDCEFTGLHKNTTLISLGVVSEGNRMFYAEFCDFDKEIIKGNKWFEENIFANTMRVCSDGSFKMKKPMLEDSVKMNRGSAVCFGDRPYVRECFLDWLQREGGRNKPPVEFISDVCHYDMVLMIDLLSGGKGAFDIPDWISPQCYDINQDIAWRYSVSPHAAFDMNREGIAKNLIPEIYESIKFPEEMKHNSLWDAELIQAIYRAIVPRREKYVEPEKESEDEYYDF